MSGLLKAEIDAAKAASDPTRLLTRLPYAVFLGMRAEARGSEVTFILPFKQDLIGNPMLPALHGGVVGGFMEMAGLIALVWETVPDAWPKTIDISFDYLRSGRPVDTYARAILAKPGRRVANLRVEAWQDDRARPIAAAHGNFLMRDPDASPPMVSPPSPSGD